ncbi:porin [Thorsellia anophelis]|uniref:Outer membrane porin protein LC n=1 Tax=Thorsellia anophelis DSM 18579 TaxID=1123402 RepID=A0A1I0DXZ7_9GAMM|nr:porin [Thorsellia anophelis]SET37560.1 outer membrane porin protein LC [Thorsellia anophelis DSM 18579]
MLNRKILAVAITTILATGAANAAEVYNKDGNKINLTGTVEAKYKFRDKQTPATEGASVDKHENEDKTVARLGFMGETQINSQLTGYAAFEHQFAVGSAEDDETRLAYVGLQYANFGSLDFGRNHGVVGLIRDFTDQAAVFGGDGFGGDTDIFLTERASSVATYSNKDLFQMVPGLDVYLQYQAKDASGAVDEQHGDGFAMTSIYHHEQTGLGFGATYANSDRTTAQKTAVGAANVVNNGKHAEMWGLAANYDANNIYFGLSWAQSNNMIPVRGLNGLEEFAPKTRGFEAVANYTFDFGLTPSIAYNQLRARHLNAYHNGNAENNNANLVKYVAIGANYAFNKNIDMAAGYKINLVKKDALYSQRAQIATDDQVEMRLTYTF